MIPTEPMMPTETMSESVRVMESRMKSLVGEPMETVAEPEASAEIPSLETVAEPEASAETPSMETVAVESVPKPGLGGGDHSE